MLSTETKQSVVYGYRAEPKGSGYKLSRFEFLKAATDAAKTWFRPSDVTVGPDGAVYVCDWFDSRVGGHTWTDDAGRGAIYRITRKGENPKPDSVDLSSIQGMVNILKNPATNVRFLGFEQVIQQADDARPELEQLLQHDNPYVAARALWPLARISTNGRETVRSILTDTSRTPRMRVAAFRALEAAGRDMMPLAKTLSTDPSPAMRREIALSMRDVPFEKSRGILMNIAERFNGEDRWYLEAFGTGVSGKHTKVYRALQARIGPPEKWSWAVARLVWRLRSPAAVDALKTRALSDLAERHRRLAIDSLAYIYHESAARAMEEVAKNLKTTSLFKRAKWYLKHHRDFQWSAYDVQVPDTTPLERIGELSRQADDQFDAVTYLNAGTNNNESVSLNKNSPQVNVQRGTSYSWDLPDLDDNNASRTGTGVYNDESVLLRIQGLKPNRRYRLGLTWWDADNNGRVQGVRIRANDRRRTLLSGARLPAHEGASQPPEHIQLALPPSFTSGGTVDVEIVKQGPSNAVVSEVLLLESKQKLAAETESTDGSGAFDGTYPAPENIASKNGDPDRGKSLFFGRATCSTCHRRGDRGRRFGPELNNLSMSKDSIINSVINPSASITHGYQATTVIKTDGSKVSGIALSKGDPVVLKMMGGNRRSIPREEIKEVQTMADSLMPSARQLRLRPQDLADLAEFLSGE